MRMPLSAAWNMDGSVSQECTPVALLVETILFTTACITRADGEFIPGSTFDSVTIAVALEGGPEFVSSLFLT